MHHGSGPNLSTSRPVQQHSEDLDNLRNNSKLAHTVHTQQPLPPDHPEHLNNLLNQRDADTHSLLHSSDSIIFTSLAKAEYTAVDMPPVYPYPSTNEIGRAHV